VYFSLAELEKDPKVVKLTHHQTAKGGAVVVEVKLKP